MDKKKSKSPVRKIELNRESVRQLSDRELAGVAGGTPSQNGCSNNSCANQNGGCKEF